MISERGAVLPNVVVQYPPGCLDSYVQSQYTVFEGHSYTNRPRESRLRPVKLSENLTPRAQAWTAHEVRGNQFRRVYSPCPHGNIHGNVITDMYFGGLTTHSFTPFSEAEKTADTTSLPLRKKIGKLKYNLSSSVAEYRESVKLFLKTARVVHKAYREIRQGKFSLFKKRKLKDIPASVLSYNFGIAPLTEDTFSAIEVLRFRMEQPLSRRMSAGTSVRRSADFFYGGWNVRAKGQLQQRTTIYFDILPSMSLSGDFDFGNPVEWVWELIPFSFVVDWLIPVGEYLGTLDAMYGLGNVRGTVTTRSKST